METREEEMKQIGVYLIVLLIGVFIGYSSTISFHLYTPTIIHDTINKRPDSIKQVEKQITKTIEKTKLIYETKKDSIIHLPDSFQFDLFRANCERYQYLLSNDSAIADF